MLRIRSHGRTDSGMVRSHNEDHFEIDDECQLYIVADGVGGHVHGEVAAHMAVASMRRFIAGAARRAGRGRNGNGTALPRPAQLLKRSIQVAHDEVEAASRGNAELLGMGTTVVGAMLRGETLGIAHVGDSRAYRRRGGELELLTQDHSWVQELIEAGVISADVARTHPLRKIVTRAVGLGNGGRLQADVCELDVRVGDVFLLCSDGLHTKLADPEIAEHLAADSELAEITRRLVCDANSRGGEDNVTVVLFKIEDRG